MAMSPTSAALGRPGLVSEPLRERAPARASASLWVHRASSTRHREFPSGMWVLRPRAGSGSRGRANCSSASVNAAVAQGLVPVGGGEGLSDGDPLDPPHADTSRLTPARAARTLTGCLLLRQLIEDAL